MKFIHTADWHLGKILYGHSLIEDQKYFLNTFFLPLLDAEKPDGVLISGDIFDRQIAPAEAIRLFDELVYEVCKIKKIPLLVSLGNHDGADRFALGARLLSDSGFHVATHLTKTVSSVRFQKDGETVDIYMLPYFDTATAREVLSDDSIKGTTESFRAVLSGVELDKSAVSIIMAHCFMAGSLVSDNDLTFVGTVSQADSAVFSEFDYAALGHLHAPQKAGAGRYSGSPLKYSFDEEKQKKSVTVIETKGKNLSVREIPVVPLHDVRAITGSFEELMILAGESKDDYIYANLTGNPVFEPMARLRTVYPNILGLRNGIDETAVSSEERNALRDQLKRTKPDDMMFFKEFLKQICGEEAAETDIAVFESILKGVGGEAE